MSLSPDTRIEVLTFKDGLLSRVAHDLRLRVDGLKVDITDGVVTATADARSVRLVCAIKKGKDKGLSRVETAEIEGKIRDTVLHADRYPEIVFEADSLTRDRVTGTLSLHGSKHPVELRFWDEDSWRVARVRLDQRDFGITPYRAMMGGLKVQPIVIVVVRTRWDG